MSPWPDKYVVGLTGNIATGKSVVRKMLEHLGAYGIDADALSHRAMARGAPGYGPIVEYFGKWILAPDRQIDRTRLGQVVFSNPGALKKLESILHPLVGQAVDILVRRAKQKVIVIEAIKLLDGELRNMCDSVWVTHVSEETQLTRLTKKRSVSETDARIRIAAQSPQMDKVASANVIINNNGSFELSWRQVVAAWKDISVRDETTFQVVSAKPGELTIQRAGPRQAGEIAAFMTQMSASGKPVTLNDVMESFGEKAFMLLVEGNKLVGLVGWQVENLVSRTTDFYLDPRLSLADAAPGLIKEIEKASRQLQSEASLLFLPPKIARQSGVWKSLGYEKRTIKGLNVRAWQEAARDSRVEGAEMLFKQLRVDRVLRPM